MPGAYSANSLGLLQRVAAQGMGIALLPEIGVRKDVEAGRLQRVLPDWAGSTYGARSCADGHAAAAGQNPGVHRFHEGKRAGS